jgi:hypothetical protein
MSRLKCVFSLCVLVLSLVPLASVFAVDQITLYVPAFEGPGALGRNVATILNLQVWQTFRRAPWPNNPENLDFGRGLVIWDSHPLPEPSHRCAEERAMALEVSAQMTMWGKVYPYGDGAVVQSYLSIPSYNDFRQHQLERWSVLYNGETITVDIPRRRQEMATILLSRNVIQRYTLPSALKLYSQRVGGRSIGVVGDAYGAIQLEPRVALVRSDGVEGWVRLPELAANRTEVVDFVGGVIRVFRGDWDGAIKLMHEVITNTETRATLKHDAYLYLAMAMEQRGRPGRAIVEQALALNPFSRTAVQYAIMCDLAQLSRLGAAAGSDQAVRLAQRVERTLTDNTHLFAPNDSWVVQVRRAIAK